MSMFVASCAILALVSSVGVLWYVVNRLDDIARNINELRDDADRRHRNIDDLTRTVGHHTNNMHHLRDYIDIGILKNSNRECTKTIADCKETIKDNNKAIKEIAYGTV